MSINPFFNRLRKRHRHLKKFASRWPTQAWRVYDKDMPEYPWTIDVYGARFLLQEFLRPSTDPHVREKLRAHIIEAVCTCFDVKDPQKQLFFKSRWRRTGGTQYEKLDTTRTLFEVKEAGHTFLVNLSDYIDTGLFLDHRAMRRMVAERIERRGARTRMLNLFAYTGAFSVYAARAGAHTTTMDMSNTYIDWAKQNFEANGIDPNDHVFIRADVTQRLARELDLGRRYDLIVLDPPTFSRSKKMTHDFDIQRDHTTLIAQSMNLLEDHGALYFSNNLRSFSMSKETMRAYRIQEITNQTLPQDFRERLHQAYLITHHR